MVVRFDNKALQQTVEKKNEPIGVEGDPPSTKKGGISEADAIVNEARKSMGDVPGKVLHLDNEVEEERIRVSQEIIREEEEKEVGPELDAEGLKNVPEMQKS
jgi:protein phosphatase PTC1